MNIPDSVARHVRSRTIIADVAANAETARRRMSAATGQLTKARNYLAKEDWEAAAIFAESALMVAFEAYLMGVKLKLGTTAGSHQAMADITAYLARRAGVAVEPYQLHDVVDARGALLYQPWDLVAQRELAESTVDVAARAVAVCAVERAAAYDGTGKARLARERAADFARDRAHWRSDRRRAPRGATKPALSCFYVLSVE